MSVLADRSRKKLKNQRKNVDATDTFGRKFLEKFGWKCDKSLEPCKDAPPEQNIKSHDCDNEGVELGEMKRKTELAMKQKRNKKVWFEDRRGSGEMCGVDEESRVKANFDEINDVETVRTDVSETMCDARKSDAIDGDVCRKKLKSKKRKHAQTFISYIDDEAEKKGRGGNDGDETSKKKKRRSLRSQDVDDNFISIAATEAPNLEAIESNRRESVDIIETKTRKKSPKASMRELQLSEIVDAAINPYEVKPKKKKKKHSFAVDNPSFDGVDATETKQTSTKTKELQSREIVDEAKNPFEVKPKKKNKKCSFAVDNPTFDGVDENTPSLTGDDFEVKRKKKKLKKERLGLDNPALNDDQLILNASSNMCMPNVDLMLNVVTLPSSARKVKTDVRKRVRFSDVNEAFVIPNCLDGEEDDEKSITNELFEINNSVIEKSLRDESNRNGGDHKGFVNNAFDIASNKASFYENGFESKARRFRDVGVDNVAFAPRYSLDENIQSISNTIDRYHAEVENDMNEAKTNRRVTNDVAMNVHRQAIEEETLLEQMRMSNGFRSGETASNRRLRNDRLNDYSDICMNVHVAARPNIDRSFRGEMQPRSFSNEDVTRSNANGLTRHQFGDTRRSLRSDRKARAAPKTTEEISVVTETQRSEVMVGEVGTMGENHERVAEGTRLSFKQAAFEPTPPWFRKEGNYAKKSYKHLIRGDVILTFKNTNLHEIKGYAYRKKKAPVEFV